VPLSGSVQASLKAGDAIVYAALYSALGELLHLVLRTHYHRMPDLTIEELMSSLGFTGALLA
jgi:hypothetical protein